MQKHLRNFTFRTSLQFEHQLTALQKQEADCPTKADMIRRLVKRAYRSLNPPKEPQHGD